MHRVLHAPDVVPGAVRRELLPYHARVWPGAGAGARHNSICGGEEVGAFGGRSESWNDHVAMRIVVFFEVGGGSGHVFYQSVSLRAAARRH